MRIELNTSQIFQAALVGIMRQTQNLKHDRKPAYGAGRDNDWQLNIEGCLGEFSVALYLRTFWDGKLGALTPGDVGALEVRTTAGENNRLIVHPDDQDKAIFILVTGCNGVYDLRGWIKGVSAKKDQYWTDPAGGRPAFFIPQHALEPMETLANPI